MRGENAADADGNLLVSRILIRWWGAGFILLALGGHWTQIQGVTIESSEKLSKSALLNV